MRRLTLCAIFMVPALLVFTTAPGCGKKEDKKDGQVKKGGNGDKKGAVNGDRTPLEAGDAVIKGSVKYDGTPPEMAEIPAMKTHKDSAGCLKGGPAETRDATWVVNKDNKGVANVVVWLEPPAGKYFALKDEDKKPAEAVIDQPHCAFMPRVTAVFPQYFDGKKDVKTGQKLKIKNSASFPHNTQWTGDGIDNPNFNTGSLPPKQFKEVVLSYTKDPLKIGCNFHTWMRGYILFFDSPYYAVTKEDGSFTFKNVPVGVELNVVGWHEGDQFYSKKQTFKKGDTLDLTIKK